LRQQRSYCILFRFTNTSTEISWSTFFVVRDRHRRHCRAGRRRCRRGARRGGRAAAVRAFVTTRRSRRVGGREQLSQRGARGSRRHLRTRRNHPSRFRPRLPSSCNTVAHSDPLDPVEQLTYPVHADVGGHVAQRVQRGAGGVVGRSARFQRQVQRSVSDGLAAAVERRNGNSRWTPVGRRQFYHFHPVVRRGRRRINVLLILPSISL
jgi:hypothetical protein